MKAYSLDLRERVVQAVAQGMTKSRAARTFSVSLATVKNYVGQVQRTGTLTPKPIPGRPREIPPEQDAALVSQLRAAQDATLAELCAAWATLAGVRVSVATMSRAIKRLKWTRKKRRWVPPSGIR
jgi:transposase